MTNDDIIRMAREAGIPETATEGVFIANSDDLGRLIAAEREANKDRIETMYQMYKMASQQRDELMQQQADALRARLAQLERNDGIELKNIEHPISLGDASDYKFSSESIEEGWLQREWQGLTDEEMRQAAQAMDAEPLAEGWRELIKFAHAIETKLKEKNGG